MGQNHFDLQAADLFKFWTDLGSPPLRTICEVGVGPQTLLEPFEKFSGKTILVEPNPSMAANARAKYPWASIKEVAVLDRNSRVDLQIIDGDRWYLKGCSHLAELDWPYSYGAPNTRSRVPVAGVTFDQIDNGEIDLLNLDCEGSEWFVLQNLRSRPILIQIENLEDGPFRNEVEIWFEENRYSMAEELGGGTYRYLKAAATEAPAGINVDNALRKAWSRIGSPSLRTIVECGGGERSNLDPFLGTAQRVVIAEPHPCFARRLSRRYPRAEVIDRLVWDTHRRMAPLRLMGAMSYATGIGWTPAFNHRQEKAAASDKVIVETCPISELDDGMIDLLIADSNGCEWGSLLTLNSLPFLIGIRLARQNAYLADIIKWLHNHFYTESHSCDSDFRIYQKTNSEPERMRSLYHPL